jgi:hypothetical protein
LNQNYAVSFLAIDDASDEVDGKDGDYYHHHHY